MTEAREVLWTRVHDALDAQRDPLCDEALLDACAQDPEFAVELLRLHGHLASMRGARARTVVRRRVRIRIAAASLAALVVVAVALTIVLRDAATEAPPRVAPGRVLAWTSVVRHRDGEVLTSARIGSSGEATRAVERAFREPSSRVGSSAGERVLSFRVRVSGP